MPRSQGLGLQVFNDLGKKQVRLVCAFADSRYSASTNVQTFAQSVTLAVTVLYQSQSELGCSRSGTTRRVSALDVYAFAGSLGDEVCRFALGQCDEIRSLAPRGPEERHAPNVCKCKSFRIRSYAKSAILHYFGANKSFSYRTYRHPLL